jgi:PAS domain S-box-containing protein
MLSQAVPIPLRSSPTEVLTGFLSGMVPFILGCSIYVFLPTLSDPLLQPAFWLLSAMPFIGAGLGFGVYKQRLHLWHQYNELEARHRHRTKVARSREQLTRAVLNGLTDCVLLVDPEGEIQDCNETVSNIFGYTRDELIGTKIEPILPDYARLMQESGTRLETASGDELGTEWHGRGRNKDGTTLPIDLIRCVPNGLPGSVYVLREATARLTRSADDIRDALDAARLEVSETAKRRGEILGLMGHNLHTEVEALLRHVQALPFPAADPVLDIAQQLLPIANRLQNLSMADDSQSALQLDHVAITGLVEELTAEIQPVAERNRTELLVSLADNIGILKTDRQKLSHAIRNLLHKASHNTREGTVTLEVEREPGRGTDWVAFHVTDTGEGMSQEEVDAMFKVIRKFNPSSSREYLEQGLGLALSQHCAKLLGGHIAVRSEPGEGSTFSLRVPMRAHRAGAHGIRASLGSDPGLS